ncbi:peptide methionine sulfoxide reductase MsrA [Mycobacteroides abscessus subsp. massiliense]|nr:peptide methionine sulfoxide reductase MsrA [Mycobacteroides abscessus subsp. massiliense]
MASTCNAITTVAVSTPHHCRTERNSNSPRIISRQVTGQPAVSPIRGDQLDRAQRDTIARMATTASSQPNAPTAVRPRTSGTVPYGTLLPMPSFSRAELEEAFAQHQATVHRCIETGDWNPYAEMYTDDALYIEHVVPACHLDGLRPRKGLGGLRNR